jgi:hypothetical protein
MGSNDDFAAILLAAIVAAMLIAISILTLPMPPKNRRR